MSWDAYITNMMVSDQSGKCPLMYVAICGTNPPSVWASTPNFNVTPEQIKALCGDPSSFAQCGPHIGPYKCRFLRDNKHTESVWCIDFKTTADSEGNAYNVCVGFTKTSMFVGVGTKEASGGQVSAAMFKNIQYLRSTGM